jgi:hypothetical protein
MNFSLVFGSATKADTDPVEAVYQEIREISAPY